MYGPEPNTDQYLEDLAFKEFKHEEDICSCCDLPIEKCRWASYTGGDGLDD